MCSVLAVAFLRLMEGISESFTDALGVWDGVHCHPRSSVHIVKKHKRG
jgi:hypothetical protein